MLTIRLEQSNSPLHHSNQSLTLPIEISMIGVMEHSNQFNHNLSTRIFKERLEPSTAPISIPNAPLIRMGCPHLPQELPMCYKMTLGWATFALLKGTQCKSHVKIQEKNILGRSLYIQCLETDINSLPPFGRAWSPIEKPIHVNAETALHCVRFYSAQASASV